MIALLLLALFPSLASALDFEDFGAPCDGVTDASAAWAAAMHAAATGRDKVIHAPACTYVFRSRPTPIPWGVRFEGTGSSGTGIDCQITNSICIELKGQGAQFWGAFIWARRGFTGNVGLLIQPRTGQAGGAGYETVRDVVVTSPDGGDWLVPIYVDGQFNRTADGKPFGARAVQFDNVRGFGGTYACAILWDAPDLQWLSGNCYRGQQSQFGVVVGGFDLGSIRRAGWIQ